MRRRGTVVGDPKIKECYRDMFCVRRRQTVKLLLVVISMTNIQGIFGVTVGNGNVFTGDVRDNLPQGNGTYTKANGFKYTGYFKDGMMKGQILVEYVNGDIYRGDVDEDGFREGKGVYNWPSGGRYAGEWRGDKKHGQGVKTWGPESKWAGDIYEGEFKQDKRNGWGRYTYKDDKNFVEYDGEWIDDDKTGYGKMVYKDESIYNGYWNSKQNREGHGLLLWPNGTCFYGQMENDEISHGMTMTPDLVFTFPPFKNKTYNGKGFKVINFTGGEIKCFQQEKDISCYNKPDEVETIYLSGFDHYFIGDTINIRKRKIRDGFGEYGVDGGYYIGEWNQGIQTGFGMKTEAFLPTIIGTFVDGVLEGLGASISFSSKHRTVYLGGYLKGQPDGPGIFIYPDGEKVLGYFIEGKLDHSKNPIYLHPDGTRDSLVPTSG